MNDGQASQRTLVSSLGCTSYIKNGWCLVSRTWLQCGALRMHAAQKRRAPEAATHRDPQSTLQHTVHLRALDSMWQRLTFHMPRQTTAACWCTTLLHAIQKMASRAITAVKARSTINSTITDDLSALTLRVNAAWCCFYWPGAVDAVLRPCQADSQLFKQHACHHNLDMLDDIANVWSANFWRQRR